MKHYFITGATGAIGSALVPVLLREPQARLTLLLRAASADEVNTRLQSLCRFWQPSIVDTSWRERLRALRGDVTLPDFGLAAADYRQLAGECTHIIHSAGNVRMNLPIEQARRSSVDSTRHIVALAACLCPARESRIRQHGRGGGAYVGHGVGRMAEQRTQFPQYLRAGQGRSRRHRSRRSRRRPAVDRPSAEHGRR
jgi:NAD(P)-dependent dehydrogenase (short-subunit alcohol dehydrogenase family)